MARRTLNPETVAAPCNPTYSIAVIAELPASGGCFGK